MDLFHLLTSFFEEIITNSIKKKAFERIEIDSKAFLLFTLTTSF